MRLLPLDPQGQLSFCQPCLQLLARLGVLLATDGLALLVQQNAVAAPKGGQWTDQVQALGGAFQLLSALLQLQLNSTGQALLQLGQPLVQYLQQTLGMLVL